MLAKERRANFSDIVQTNAEEATAGWRQATNRPGAWPIFARRAADSLMCSSP
jgi:hypothetical protein